MWITAAAPIFDAPSPFRGHCEGRFSAASRQLLALDPGSPSTPLRCVAGVRESAVERPSANSIRCFPGRMQRKRNATRDPAQRSAAKRRNRTFVFRSGLFSGLRHPHISALRISLPPLAKRVAGRATRAKPERGGGCFPEALPRRSSAAVDGCPGPTAASSSSASRLAQPPPTPTPPHHSASPSGGREEREGRRFARNLRRGSGFHRRSIPSRCAIAGDGGELLKAPRPGPSNWAFCLLRLCCLARPC